VRVTCDECGFDLALWDDSALETTLLAAPALARATGADECAAGLPREGVNPEAVHELMHRLHLAGRARHATTPSQAGTAVQLNLSGGGVPKLPVEEVRVRPRGVEGDRQDDRRNHGRPWQAVSLWSAKVVDALAAQGHPIGYGRAGENVTVRGLDWSLVTPGARLGVGDALLQVSAYAIPCAKNAQWFSDGGFRRMSHEVDPAGSRLYASVLREGVVRVGDPVVLEP
jgi:MOSC domain-containing protein YiiM